MLTYGHFLFRIVGMTTTRHAEMLPVRDGATADRKDVVEAIKRKVKRYRATATEYDIPFVVVLSADEDTAMDVSHVENILEGKNSMAISLPVYGVGSDRHRTSRTPPKRSAAPVRSSSIRHRLARHQGRQSCASPPHLDEPACSPASRAAAIG